LGEYKEDDEESLPSLNDEVLPPNDYDSDESYDEYEPLPLAPPNIAFISDLMNQACKDKDEPIHGIVWESDTVLQAPKEPIEKLSMSPATLKPQHSHRFETAIESFLSFCPPTWFKKITYETNKYAIGKFDSNNGGFGKFKVCGVNFEIVKVREILHFHGLLVMMMLYPARGRCYSTYWRYKDLYPWMPSGKFHFKAYCVCCPQTFVMTSIRFATRDSMERAMPVNLKRKRVDAVEDVTLEDDTSCNERDDGASIDDESSQDPKIDAIVDESSQDPKIDAIVKDCTKHLRPGTTINLDNYYTSIATAVSLRKKQIYIRGTLRSNRKFIPKKILLTKTEARQCIRGYRKIAVAKNEGIVAVSWVDTKPVILLSTADGTEESQYGVLRKDKSSRNVIPAPLCVEKYNKSMGGVDKHDQLRSSFSLHKRHTFMRWYVQFYLCLFDIAATNARICYNMKNPGIRMKNKESGADFFEKICNYLLSRDGAWLRLFGLKDVVGEFLEVDAQDEHLEDLELVFRSPVKQNKETSINQSSDLPVNACARSLQFSMVHGCTQVDLRNELSYNCKVCQICSFEGWPNTVLNVVVCSIHRIRLCALPRKKILTDTSFIGSVEEGFDQLSCWDKAHSFYLCSPATNIFGKVPKRDHLCCRYLKSIRLSNNVTNSSLIERKAEGIKTNTTLRVMKKTMMKRLDGLLYLTRIMSKISINA